MFRKMIVFTLLSVFLMSLAGMAMAHQKSWPGKRLAQIFPEASGFISRQATLSPEQIAAIEKEVGLRLQPEEKAPAFYFAQKQAGDKTERIGIVLFMDVLGAKGEMEVGVGIDKKGNVARVVIFEHREDSKIAEPSFLSQFNGKTPHDSFMVGEDVKSLEGMDGTVQSLSTGVWKALLITQAVYGKKDKK